MILKPEVHHPNDVTVKYLIDVLPEKLHEYLKLPGKFVRNYPVNIIRRDGSERQMDWLFLVEPDNETLFESILINVEFQSAPVGEDKIKIIADYRDYSKTYYGFPVLSVIVIFDGLDKSKQQYSRVSSDIIRPIYIHMELSEIIERLNNLEIKITNHIELTNEEAFDIVFLAMFSPKNKANFVTEKITRLFSKDKSLTGTFRNDIAFSLSIMIRKYFDLSPKGKELLSLLEEEIKNNRLRDVVDFEVDYVKKSYEKELAEKERVLSEMNGVLSEKDKALSEMNGVLSEKDNEINLLKAKLKENGIK